MSSTGKWGATFFSLALIWAIALVGPVAAHHKSGHSQGGAPTHSQGTESSSTHSNGGGSGGEPDGDADSDSGTAYTEDNDTNDGGTPNNVSDEGDNWHPSGKDRSVENGNSGNQGKSESDPDDDTRGPERTNGGPDKPNGVGGWDLADQDGNNGCGNDDDFEDDNEGWCRRAQPSQPPKPPQPPEVKPEDEEKGVKVVVDAVLAEDEVKADLQPRPRAVTVAAAREAAPLPFTGAGIGAFVVVAIGAIATGLFLLRSRRTQE
jgi:hypothetical protein